jgi:hypothetical protein
LGSRSERPTLLQGDSAKSKARAAIEHVFAWQFSADWRGHMSLKHSSSLQDGV